MDRILAVSARGVRHAQSVVTARIPCPVLVDMDYSLIMRGRRIKVLPGNIVSKDVRRNVMVSAIIRWGMGHRALLRLMRDTV